MNKTAAILILLLIHAGAEAQLIEFPLPGTSPKSGRQTARTQAIDPAHLPFFDDFASSDTLLRDTLWLYGQSVSLNNGVGIRPPSKNVVSFDGTDSLGKPYNINDVLAKGFADRLTSQPIRMDLVPAGERPTVYFSFFYELRGRGEPPDPGDQFILAFKAQDGSWENVYVLETDPATPTDVFQQVILPVEDRFFHDNFQFRFFNYARLSGPYDTWNLDYVYLNRLRDANDLYYPDRTISSPLTSLFDGYYSIPLEHFLEDIPANLVHPVIELYNLKLLDSASGLPHVQPIKYNTVATFNSRIAGSDVAVTKTLDTLQYPGADLPGLQFLTVTLNTLPDPADFDPAADSIHLRIDFSLISTDNVPSSSSSLGDYNPQKYSPVDFRYNDTLSVNYILSSYYAYDDGTAEYAAGLNQAGSYLAYQFNSRIDSVDTVTYVDIYFPEFGDNTNQSLLLQIRSILGDISLPPLFEQLIVVNRTTKNKLVRYPLYRAVPVGGTFYIGWKQITNASIPVGLDKNTDNGGRIYYNTTGDWVQNTLVEGSMMIRPGFGKSGGDVVTGLEKPLPVLRFYPNPTAGVCVLNAKADRVEAYDQTGRSIELAWEHFGESTRVTLAPTADGLILIRVLSEGRLHTEKIMVRSADR